MIFKTFNNDIDKWTAKIGVFGKSFNAIFDAKNQRKIDIDDLMLYQGIPLSKAKKQVGGLSSYLFPKKEDIQKQLIDVDKLIPKIDISNATEITEKIKKMSESVTKGEITWQKLFDILPNGEKHFAKLGQQMEGQIITTEGVVKANQQARASALAHNEAIKTQTLSAKAGKVALQGLAMAGNMIAMWVVSKVVSGLYELSQVSENVAESAKELGDSFKDTSSDIEGYKSKIEELYKVINDEGASIEDVTNARKSLMSVQDELIDKFGTEKGVINDVTDAINGQTGALDRLSNAKWQEVKNEFNDGGFWNDISNSLGGYSDNIDRMIDEYEDYHARIRLNDFINKDSLLQVDAFKSLLENNFDAEITFDASEGSEIAMLSGNANEIYEKLLDIQNLADQFHFSDSFENSLTKLANSARETSDKYKDFYNQYILYEKILTEDSDYVNTFKDITDAYEEYRNAFISNDESKIKQATENYAKVLTDATSTAIANSDSDVATYFENMYPTLKTIVDGWNFNIAFDANTNDLQDKVQNILNELKDEDGRSLTAEEILGLNESNAQYQALVAIAHTYNMTIEEMIELLKKRNLVSAMDYQGLVGLFGQDNVDKLSPEDLEIAYTIKNVGSMTFEQLQSEIQKTKETADEPENLSQKLLSATDSLDKFQSSVKSAYDAYNTLLSTDCSSSDLLDSIQTINQAATDMGQSINWEFLDSWGDSLKFIGGQKSSLELLGDVIEDVSKKYAETVLSDAGIDITSKFDQALANSIVQSQKASQQLQSLNGNIDSLQSAYSSLTDIVETYNKTGSVTFDQLQTLLEMEPQYLSCLIDENGQLQLNEQAMVSLANQRLNDAEAQAVQQAITELGQLALQDEKNAVQENRQAFADAVSDLALYNQELGNTIAEATIGAAAIRDLNGAINGAEAQGASDEQINTVLDNLNAKLQAIGSVRDKINSGGLGNVLNPSSKSSSSEKDLWLEEYKRKLEELKRQLNQGRLMPSPVVIQDV